MCNSLSTHLGADGPGDGGDATSTPAKLHRAHARASMNLYVIYPWTTMAAPAPRTHTAAKLMAKLLRTRTRSRLGSGTVWDAGDDHLCAPACVCVCAPNICEIITFEIMRLNVSDNVRKFGAKIARLRWMLSLAIPSSATDDEHTPPGTAGSEAAETAATKGVMTRVIGVHMHHCRRPLSHCVSACVVC